MYYLIKDMAGGLDVWKTLPDRPNLVSAYIVLTCGYADETPESLLELRQTNKSLPLRDFKHLIIFSSDDFDKIVEYAIMESL